jgi:hypothetical protein
VTASVLVLVLSSVFALFVKLVSLSNQLYKMAIRPGAPIIKA